MNEKIKHQDADPARDDDDSRLDEGLEETFPASDPVSATRAPRETKDEADKPTRPRQSGRKSAT